MRAGGTINQPARDASGLRTEDGLLAQLNSGNALSARTARVPYCRGTRVVDRNRSARSRILSRRARASRNVLETAPVLLHLLAAALVLIGLAGLILPVLPGAPLIFVGLLLTSWADDFEYVGAVSLVLLGLLALLTYVVDFAASAFGARRFGASARAAVGAGLGALVGLFFGLPGVLLGPFAGAVAGELSNRRKLGDAGRAGLGATLGLVIGAALKLALAFTMLALYAFIRIIGFA